MFREKPPFQQVKKKVGWGVGARRERKTLFVFLGAGFLWRRKKIYRAWDFKGVGRRHW